MTTPFRTRRTLSRSTVRRTTGALAAVLAIATCVATSITAAPTQASWSDAEWDNATVSTLDCGPDSEDLFTTRASGKLIGGQLGTVDLDSVAEVYGVAAVNGPEGVVVVPPPPASNSLGEDAYANPLDVSAVDALYASLGDLLVLPLNSGIGVNNTFAQVRDDGTSTGASGAVLDSGAIQLEGSNPPPTPPTYASIQLRTLVESVLGQSLAGVAAGLADASLDVGAIASNATLDACAAAWTGSIVSGLQRQYGIASLDLSLESPTVETLVTNTTTTIDGLEGVVEGLSTNSGVLTSLTNNLSSALSGILGTLGLGSVSITNLTATVNTTAVKALLDDTISDGEEIVSIDLDDGTIAISLDGLLGAAYGTVGLNGLAPNTQLLINDAVVNALTVAVEEALGDWVEDLELAIAQALSTATIGGKVVVNVLQGAGPPVASIALTIPEVSLQTLLTGKPAVTSSITLAGGTACGGLATVVICGLLNALLGTSSGSGLTGSVAKALGSALNTAFFASGTGLVDTTGDALLALTTPVVSLVADATRGLFGENSLLSLTANAQNAPVPANANPQPGWSLPGPDAATRSTGQYDVAALRLTAVGLQIAPLVQLDLARSSVGSSEPR